MQCLNARSRVPCVTNIAARFDVPDRVARLIASIVVNLKWDLIEIYRKPAWHKCRLTNARIPDSWEFDRS